MKISAAMLGAGMRSSTLVRRPASGFTMVEVAISLAIIGFALVAIIASLPMGLNVQRDNREQTVINQDATIFMEAIRNGTRGADDLTNYVYAITNFWGKYSTNAQLSSGINGYDYNASSVTTPYPTAVPSLPINNGLRIIGLLSTPKFQLDPANPNNIYSNHMVAYVRSMSGPAVEKPPQDNQIIQQDSFGYRILCDNVPVQTAETVDSAYSDNLTRNLHELRLTFLWPQLPNGKLGGGHWTYRSLVAGQIAQIDDVGNTLYFFQSQSFTNAP